MGILKALVDTHIETGQAISSNFLYENYDFGIKPAMIRWELTQLTDAGYLRQPYHSSGRVPSNKGYEAYVRIIMNDEDKKARIPNHVQEAVNAKKWEDVTDRLSDALGVLMVAYAPRIGVYAQDGLDDLFENLEWENRQEVTQIIKDIEMLEDAETALAPRVSAHYSRSPWLRSKRTSRERCGRSRSRSVTRSRKGRPSSCSNR